MTKVTKFSSLAVLAVVLCGIYKTASIAMAASADYSRADWLTFYLIAPSEVKHAPSSMTARRFTSGLLMAPPPDRRD